LAEKSEDPAKMQQVLEQKNAAMDKAGVEFIENKEQEAAKIKAKYDELAKNIKIDSKSLISALLVRKKEVSSFQFNSGSKISKNKSRLPPQPAARNHNSPQVKYKRP
jgi:hypothetical protein